MSMTGEDAFRASRNLKEAGEYALSAAIATKGGYEGSTAGFEAAAIASMRSAADSFGLALVPVSDREQNENIPKMAMRESIEKALRKSTGVNPKDAIGATKVPMGYFPPAALLYATLGMWNGDVKYDKYNWRDGGKVLASIYIDAVERHLALWKSGEEIADSGVPHLGHAMAGLAILIDAYEGGYLVDDRPEHQFDFGTLLEQWNAKAPELLKQWKAQRPVVPKNN